MRVVKRGKYDRRSLAALDGISSHNKDKEEEEGILAVPSEKKPRERRSIGGKVEKKKSTRFSKLSLKTLFFSAQPKGPLAGPDLDSSRTSCSGTALRRNSVSPCPSFLDLSNTVVSIEPTLGQPEESQVGCDQKEEMNLVREAGHTPKLHRVKPVNPGIVIDLIKDKENGDVTESKEVMHTSTANGKVLSGVSQDRIHEEKHLSSKKKSKREPWRRKTISLFCGIRRKDLTSTGSNSPFETQPNDDKVQTVSLRSSPRISTSTPLGMAEAISKVDSLVLSSETPIQEDPYPDHHTLVGVKTPKTATKIKTELNSERRVQPERLCKSAVKNEECVHSKFVMGTGGKICHKRNSLLHAMQESQLVAMNANGSMVVNSSPVDGKTDMHAHNSILSNLSKYKIKKSPKKSPTTPSRPKRNTTSSKKHLEMSLISSNSETFDKTLNLSHISASSPCSWLEKSLNANADDFKVTRSKSVKKVTMDTERVEIIGKGRKAVTLRRRMSSVRKGKDENKHDVSMGNRQHAGHTPRVHRKKEQPFDERLI